MLFIAPWLHRASFYVLPGICRLCKSETGVAGEICSQCVASFAEIKHPCRRCGLPMQSKGRLAYCGQCLLRPPAFTACVAPFVYEGAVQHLHHRFKFSRDLAAGQLLAELLAKRLKSANSELADGLVPMPIHWRRHLVRGFNQAEVICQTLCTRLNLPRWPVLKRTSLGLPQQTLSAKKRQANVAKAFACKDPKGSIQGRHVALIDDICTTGATAKSAANTLLKAGAARVDIWCVARAVI